MFRADGCGDGGVDPELFGAVPELDGAVAGPIHELELVDRVHGEQQGVCGEQSADAGEVGECAGDDSGRVAVPDDLAVQG